MLIMTLVCIFSMYLEEVIDIFVCCDNFVGIFLVAV